MSSRWRPRGHVPLTLSRTSYGQLIGSVDVGGSDLGCSSKPDEAAGEFDEAEIGHFELVMPSGDASKLFGFIGEALDSMACLVELTIPGDRDASLRP